MCRDNLIQYLLRHNHLWSYDPTKASQLPDSILIEQTLVHSDVDGLMLLFDCFEKSDIRAVWESEIVPHQRHHKLNIYLGTFFFRIPDIYSFLQQRTREYPRLERLKLLAAEDQAGTA
jgi:hypothetical protein